MFLIINAPNLPKLAITTGPRTNLHVSLEITDMDILHKVSCSMYQVYCIISSHLISFSHHAIFMARKVITL